MIGRLRQRLGALVARSPWSRKQVGSGVFLGVGAIALIIAMFLADGLRASRVDLTDAGVWVTKTGSYGRINARALAQDFSRAVSGADAQEEVDVAQSGRLVLVKTGGALQQLDVATMEATEAGTVAPDAEVHVGAGRVLVVQPGTEVSAWVVRIDQMPFRTEGAKPWRRLGVGGAATIDRSGRILAFDSDTGRVLATAGAKVLTTDVEVPPRAGAGDVQVSAVGDRAVVLDRRSRTVVVEGGDRTPLPASWGDAAALQLQLPGDDGEHVLVAAPTGLYRVPLSGGSVEPIERWASDGAPPRPVRVAGCDYGAVGGSDPLMVTDCGRTTARKALRDARGDRPAPTNVGQLRFRVNGRHAVLNELESGESYMFDGKDLYRVEDWDLPKDPGPAQENQQDNTPRVLDLTKENTPPDAQDDDEFGARAGIPTPLPVLDNDLDVDGDLLSVRLADDVDLPEGVTVAPIAGSQQLQIEAAEPQTVTFDYEVSDGRAKGTDTATVTVTVVDATVNTPPEPKPAPFEPEPFRVESKVRGSYDAAYNFWDREGDPIVFETASVAAPDQVVVEPGGLVTFTDVGETTGRKPIALTLRDAPPPGVASQQSGPQRLDVEVVAAGDQRPPVLRPDYLTTVVDQPVIISPLANDSDPNGDELRVVKVIRAALGGATGVEVGDPLPDNTIRFVASAVGSYPIGYEVLDGSGKTTVGLIRVDVREADNRAPSAGRDLVVLPVTSDNAVRPARTVDLLANDVDPDGDVLVVRSIAGVPLDGLVRAQLVDRRRLRVSAKGALPETLVLTYELHDGSASATGSIFVTTQQVEDVPDPLAVDDRVDVRVGDIVSVPVLANDVDPLGGELHLVRTLTSPPTSGSAWVSGRVVRFMAPSEPGTIDVFYGVARSSDAEDAVASGRLRVRVLPADDDANTAPRPKVVEARVLAGRSVRIPIPLGNIDADGDSVSLLGLTFDGDQAVPPTRGRVVTPVGTDYLDYEAFDAAAGGTDTFTYMVRDRRGATAIGSVRVGVVPRPEANGAPVAVEDHVRVRPGATVRVPVRANDYDPDDDPIGLVDDSVVAPPGLTAEPEEGSLVITAPDAVGAGRPVTYVIEDPSGLPSQPAGVVEVNVDPAAPGLAPIARDDDVRTFEPGAAQVQVDVRANDDDPDGDPAVLAVAELVDLPDVSEQDGKLVIALTPAARVVAYTVTDVDGLTATAVVRVPPASGVNQPPEAIRLDAPLQAKEGSELKIPLKNVVLDPEGADVRLTSESRIRALHHDGSSLVRDGDDATLWFVPEADYSGDAAITFEVTDGQSSDDPQGARAVITVPIRITRLVNEKPVWTSVPRVAGLAPFEGPQTIVLSALVRDDEDDPLTFELVDPQLDGVVVDLQGDSLSVTANDDAVPGPRELGIRVRDDGAGDGDRWALATAEITVVETTREVPICVAKDFPAHNGGEAIEVDVTEQCNNPFADQDRPLTLASAAGPIAVTTSGTTIAFTPPRQTATTMTITYEVEDARQRRAPGVITVTIRDVPATPQAPEVVSVGSRTVQLRWTAPEANGANIDDFVVRWSGGEQRCGPVTVCDIVGLQNAQPYTFRLAAQNEVGESEQSPASEPATPDKKPDPPATVTLTFDPARPDGKLTVGWAASLTEGSAVTGYQLTIAPPPLTGNAIVNVGPVTNYQLDGLENGTPYTVEVQGRNSSLEGLSEPTRSNSEFPAKKTSVPTGVAALRVNDALGGVGRVSWTAPSDVGGAAITEYRVSAFAAGAGTPVREVTVPGTQTTVEVRDLENDVAHTFKVIAVNKAGPSEPSAASPAVELSGTPDRIASVTVEDADGITGLNGKLRLRFTVPDNQASGEVATWRIYVNGALQTKTASGQAAGSTETVIISGLANGTGYRFTVQGCNAVACAVASPTTNPATPYGPPPAPRVVVESVAQYSVTFRVSSGGENGRPITGFQASNGQSLGAGGGTVTIGAGCEAGVSVWAVATDNEGQTSSRGNASGTTGACPQPPPSPSVSASWGASASDRCGGCYWINYSVRDFAPGDYTIQCLNGGTVWYTSTFTFNVGPGGTGGVTTSANTTNRSCFWGNARGSVQIRVNGVTSGNI